MKLNMLRGIIRIFAVAAVLTAVPVQAEITRVGPSKGVIGGAVQIGNDVAYDPAHQVYLVVSGYGSIYGVFVNTAGDPLTQPFPIGSANPSTAFGHYPRAEFSPAANGGQGGFLVTWHQNGEVHAVIAAYPHGVISAEQVLGGGVHPLMTGLGIAYSSRDNRFLVVWTSTGGGTVGRFIHANGSVVGVPLPIVNDTGTQFPSVVWNPATDEFGVAYAAYGGNSAWVGFLRVRGSDGVPVSAPTTLGFGGGTFATDISVNTGTHRYVMAWSIGTGSRSAEFDASGNLLSGPTLISTRIGSPYTLSVAYNKSSGTFLAISEDMAGTPEVVAAELNGGGIPLTSAAVVTQGAQNGSFVPRVTARSDANHWNISFVKDYTVASNQIVATGGSAPPPSPPPPAGGGKSDITVYRPSDGTWYSLTSTSGWTSMSTIRWGLRGDVPLQADFDADRRPDIVAYRPSTGEWDVLFSSTGYSAAAAVRYQWGAAGDIPVPADYTGDGRTDIAVWRPGNGAWYIYDLALQRIYSYQWGASTDIPLTGDFDGDRIADLIVYRPSSGYWFIVFSSTGGAAAYGWGIGGDIPVPGDYNGDGRTDFGVYRPSNGLWLVFHSGAGTFATYQWGNSAYTPAPWDYDGDGRTDLAVWNSSSGRWYIYFTGTNTFGTYVLGSPGDIPLP